MRPDEIERSMPLFNSPEEALGWAYVVERSTLAHANLFRHLAQVMPGDVAFTSAYLKCYFGAVGENWKAFGTSLSSVATTVEKEDRLVDAAKSAFRLYRMWRHLHEEALLAKSQGEVRERHPA